MGSATAREHYHALVDMGRYSSRSRRCPRSWLTLLSNAIRFSISDLSPPKARILPTLFQDRCDISLYDVQYHGQNKVPIPQPIINDILDALLRFKQTCQDFRVPSGHTRIVATEATRTSSNCADFLDQIHGSLGIKVETLAKEEEGR